MLANPPQSGSATGGGTLGLTHAAFYKKPSMLAYTGARICWSSLRGTIGDYTESLGGICFLKDETGFCYTRTTITSQGDRTHELGCATSIADVLHADTMYYQVTTTAVTGNDLLTDSYHVDWTTPTDNINQVAPGPARPRYCYRTADDQFRACLVYPTTQSGSTVKIPPNYFESEYHLGYEHDLSIGLVPGLATPLRREVGLLCGCTMSIQNDSTLLDHPGHYCRSNVDHTCYHSEESVCTTSDDEERPLDFNCGTFFGFFPINKSTNDTFNTRYKFNRLCTGCAPVDTNGRKTVGQCIANDGSRLCAGIDVSGNCPTNYSICQEDQLYPTGIPAGSVDIPGGVKSTFRATLDHLGSDGIAMDENQTIIDIFGRRATDFTEEDPNQLSSKQRWIPDVVGGITTMESIDDVVKTTNYDGVNCVGVSPQMDIFTHYATVETPRYLSTADAYAIPSDPNYPDGLTEPAIAAWCAASSSCSRLGDPRHYLCNDASFALATNKEDTTGKCIIRRFSDYQYQEKDEGGGQTEQGITSVSK
jgi:hypothetical protein